MTTTNRTSATRRRSPNRGAANRTPAAPLAAVAALTLVLSTGACAAPTGEPPARSTGSGSQNTRTVTDIDGTRVQLPAQVDRVADLWHANNQVVLLLGGQDKLVATTKQVQALPWFVKVYPKIKDLPAPAAGTDVNMEELQASKPQVVLASDKGQIQAARAQGLAAVRVDFQNFNDLKRTVDITADVIGTDDARHRATTFDAELNTNVALVQNRLKGLKDADRPKVLHIAGGDDLTKVDGSDSLIGQWMAATGATNSLSGVKNLQSITLEQIIASNPDIIDIGGTTSHQGIEAISKDPAWANVTAVKDKEVIANPVGTFNWDRYSAEEALQVLWAAKTFHPAMFRDVDLVTKTQAFYRTYYGYDLSAADATRIITGQAPTS